MTSWCEDYRKAVESYTGTLLKPYLQNIGQDSFEVPGFKEFNDPIWQTIKLYPFEVMIVDSPLLQRLRRIRQLGVVHWTYHSAEHTRFQHSLGALHQVQRILDTLNTQTSQPTIDPSMINLLRLAALCHDIGHGVMSHVSENAIQSIGSLENLLQDLKKTLRSNDTSLSEAAAYYILGSPAFGELVDRCHTKTMAYPYPLPTDWRRMLPQCILGKKIDEKFINIQDLISGPFDADKLDYMTRDALMTGVPIVTDIPRLIQKARLGQYPEEELPDHLKAIAQTSQAPFHVVGISLSGAATLDELIFGRTLLFEKVYRHQKVRAVESMIGNILACLFEDLTADPIRIALFPLCLYDHDFIVPSLEKFQQALAHEIPNGKIKQHIIDELSKRLQDRNLFIRAYAFSSDVINDAYINESKVITGLDLLKRTILRPERRHELKQQIIHEIQTINITAGLGLDPAQIPYLVALDPPPNYFRPSEAQRACLITRNNKLHEFRKEFGDAPGWSNAYLLPRHLGYVFAARELATSAFLACEVVFRRLFDFYPSPVLAEYTGVNRRKIKELRRSLSDKGYYQDKPRDLRAQPEMMYTALFRSRISRLVTKFGSYDGLQKIDEIGRKDLVRSIKVNISRIINWISQFDDEPLIEAALLTLEQIHLLGRKDLHDAVRQFIACHPEFKRAAICPFGSPKDSSAIMTYYAGDLENEFQFRITSLIDALSDADRPILFIDDLTSSGGQADVIINGWFGRVSSSGPDESHGFPLTEPFQKELLHRRIGILFVFGENSAIERVNGVAKELELSIVPHLYLDENLIPKAFQDQRAQQQSQGVQPDWTAFKTRCQEIGRELLRQHDGKPRSEEWIADRWLGFGNQAYLLLFPYNTPTQALTCLWADGKMPGGWNWVPLFPRRAKL